MRQNLGWAVGYNAIALPIAAGVFEPAFGLQLTENRSQALFDPGAFIPARNHHADGGVKLRGSSSKLGDGR